MNRADILAVVQAIYFGPKQTAIISRLLSKLHLALPHLDIRDLIFWNPIELTPEQVVNEAMRREAEHARKADSYCVDKMNGPPGALLS